VFEFGRLCGCGRVSMVSRVAERKGALFDLQRALSRIERHTYVADACVLVACHTARHCS